MPSLVVNPETGFLESPQHDAFSSVKKVKFLELFEKCKDITEACNAVGVNYRTYYWHKHRDDKFGEEVKLIEQKFADHLIGVALKHAEAPNGVADRWIYVKAKRPEFKENYQPSVQFDVNIVGDIAKKLSEVIEAQVVHTEKQNQLTCETLGESNSFMMDKRSRLMDGSQSFSELGSTKNAQIPSISDDKQSNSNDK